VKDDGLFTIGQLARRTGLSTKTIRFYSDAGLVPETGRSHGGYRLYDVAALARLELIRTLRDLGLGLAAIREVLNGTRTAAGVVRRHVETLDEQIGTLTRRRAVLRAVVKREPTGEELVLMSKLAAMSDEERVRVITEYWDEAFGGVDINPGFESKVRMATPGASDWVIQALRG
jgi:DNA-binding transcriptional MerR regulator